MSVAQRLLGATTMLCAFALPAVAQVLQPGTYRCASYNVSGGGGSCRTFQPLVLSADGTYRHSSTRGRWRVQGARLLLSESTLWGPGEVIGNDTIRFEYDYRGWRHIVTWICEECSAGSAGREAAEGSGGSPPAGHVGVTLTLEFDQPIGGVSGFVIVPAESAGRYTHNAPLPQGAIQGLAWETGPNLVHLATNRYNKLVTGRRYVVFLSWPRETLPVAMLDLPLMERDYTATLRARLNIPLDTPGASQPRSRSDSREEDGGSLTEALGALSHALQDLGRTMESAADGSASTSAPKPPPIGVHLTDVTPEIAHALGNADLRGAGIVEVLPSSLAELAGARAGDVITTINDRRIQTASEALDLIRNRGVAAPLELVVFRDGRLYLLRVRVTAP